MSEGKVLKFPSNKDRAVSSINNLKVRSPYLNSRDSGDFANRMQRIRASLEKINSLMADLKKVKQ